MKHSLSTAIKESLMISIPIAGTFFLNILTNFIAVIYLSHFGDAVLAASALIFSLQVAALVISMSTLYSISVLVGRAYSENKLEETTRLLQQGWLLAIILSAIITVIFLSAPHLFIFFGQDKNLAMITGLYFHSLVIGTVPIMLQTACQQFAMGVLKQKLVIISSFICLLSTTFFGYALGFGHFGFPKLGVSGIGLAIGLQYWVGFLFMLSQFLFNKFFKPFAIFKIRPINRFAELKLLFNIGWPISVQVGAELLAIFSMTVMTGWLGKISLSARQVANQYLVFTIVPVIGVAQACGILVSYSLGKKFFSDIRRILIINLWLAFAFIIWFFLAFLLIPNTLARVYININDQTNTQLLHLVQLLLLIACFSQAFDSIRNITSGALRGLYDTRYPMMMGFIGLWLIAIPLGYILAFNFHLGVIGLSIGFAIGVTVAACFQMRRWWQQSVYEVLEKTLREQG